MLWKLKRLLSAASGPTGRDVDEKEPMSIGYSVALTKLLVSGKIDLSTWVWALRARPASVCGKGGTYGIAEWVE